MSARATATSPAEVPGNDGIRPPTHNKKKKPGHRLTPQASILAFVVFLAAIFAVAPARAYLEQRSERGRLAHEVQQLQQENDALQQRLTKLHDPIEMERLARECLGLVDPGEIAFVPVRPNAPPPAPSCD
jgi:cell division protein FtsB